MSHRGAVLAALGAIGILTIVATTLVGCGSSTSASGSGGQSGSGAGGLGAAGSGGPAGTGGGAGGGTPVAVWSSDATMAVVEDDGGGFTGPPPAGSDCGYGVGAYTFTVADDKLAWHACDTSQPSSTTPFKYVDGARLLTAEERDMLVEALKGVVLATEATCGADKSTRLLTVTRPNGAATYRDSFYSCMHLGTYVDGIDAVFNVARALAK